MSEVIRYGAGGVPYKSFKADKVEEVKPEVTPEPAPVVEEVVVEVTEGPEVETPVIEGPVGQVEVPVTIGSG